LQLAQLHRHLCDRYDLLKLRAADLRHTAAVPIRSDRLLIQPS
jgi:hypothetical protein